MEFITFFETIVQYMVFLFEAFGVLVIIWGGFLSIYYYIIEELKQSPLDKIEKVRFILGTKMLIGLEFFLAGDVLGTVVQPTWNSIGLLGALVVIRTVLSYYLEREVHQKKHFSGKASN